MTSKTIPSASAEPGFTDRLSQITARVKARLGQGLYSESRRYGLRRDLTVPFTDPQAKIPITVRPLEPADLDTVLPIHDPGLEPADRLEIARRRSFAAQVTSGGYVAIDMRTQTPCYVQWLISARRKDVMRHLKGFPELPDDYALLENAYTPPKSRGLGIMSAAMSMIAARAADHDARFVVTFVGDDNVASLKGCERSGFAPYCLQTRRFFAFGAFSTSRTENI